MKQKDTEKLLKNLIVFSQQFGGHVGSEQPLTWNRNNTAVLWEILCQAAELYITKTCP